MIVAFMDIGDGGDGGDTVGDGIDGDKKAATPMDIENNSGRRWRRGWKP